MWVRRAAIRPVPAYAKVSEAVLSRLEDELTADAEDTSDASDLMNDALERLERDQPVLAQHMTDKVGRYNKEPVVGVGYFLMIAVYLAFERAFPGDLERIDETSLASVEEALALDEEIRKVDPAEVVESDDVVAMEQPHILRYVQDHVGAALETHADELDVDEVHAIYRAVLVETLALSYAVKAPSTSIRTDTGEFSA